MAENNSYMGVIRSYIQRELGKGESKENIRKKVIEKGYPESMVNEIMNHLDNTKKYVYISIFAILILAVVISVFFVVNKNQVPPLNVTANPDKLLAEGKVLYAQCNSDMQNRCLAVLNKDGSYCNKITGTLPKNLRQDCTATVYLISYYIQRVNEDKCKNIFTSILSQDKKTISEECTKILSALQAQDENACDNTACKDKYNFLNAENKKDITLCDKIQDSTTKQDCKMLVSSSIDYCDYSACLNAYNKFIIDGSNHTITPQNPEI